MAAIDRGQLVEVSVGECRCPGAPRPHPDGDLVWMHPKPTMPLGFAAQAVIDRSGTSYPDTWSGLFTVFVRYGVAAWNLVDESGRRLPVTPDAVEERLGWEGGLPVADRAADLYTDAVLAPLRKRSDEPPPVMHSNGSTSPTPLSGPKRRTSRPPSSASRQAAGKKSGTTGASP